MSKHNKEDIIDMGIEMMRANGYYGTGIQQVLKACKIPKGSFYHFFDSKQDFALQAIDKYAEENISDLQRINSDPNLGPLEKLKRFFLNLSQFYESQNYQLTCLMSIISFEIGTTDPIISAKIHEKFNKIKALIEEILEKGQRIGEIKADISPSALADFLINSFNGTLITMKYEGSSRAMEQFVAVSMQFIEH